MASAGDMVQTLRRAPHRSRQRQPRAWPWLIVGLMAIVAGFWPTFFGDPLSNDRWHTIHGIASTLWVVLLIAQSLLVGRGNRRLHERLGWSSLALVTVLIGSSAYMVWIEITDRAPFPRDLRLTLIFIDVIFLALFVAAYALGVLNRRRPRVHARLMASTILIGLGPALGRLYAKRIPALGGLAGALPPTMWTIEAVLVIAILLEARRGRVLWPLPAMLAAFALTQLGMHWATGDAFAGLARAAGAPV